MRLFYENKKKSQLATNYWDHNYINVRITYFKETLLNPTTLRLGLLEIT